MLSWGPILGLCDGILFMLPALLLGAAAVASIVPLRGAPARDHEDRTMSLTDSFSAGNEAAVSSALTPVTSPGPRRPYWRPPI
jgi:hypothetical protein